MKDLGQELKELIEYDIYNCIGCNSCMDACPVTKDLNLTIAELNEATISEKPPKKEIYDFTVNCVQCGRCVPVCPPQVRRDLMMLWLKSKIKNYPSEYDKYVSFKQPNLSGFKRGLMKIKNTISKKDLGKLYNKIDTEDLKKADLLFYPGCYIYNADICLKTLDLMDYLNADYEIIGGVQTCCGWPQYLQGRMEMAEKLIQNLWRLIQKVDPKIIITTCAECFAAVRKIKARFNANFEILSTTEWLYRNIDKFKVEKLPEDFTFHESCHLSRKYRQYEIPRNILKQFGNFIEMENIKDKSMCCYYYNFNVDPNQEVHRKDRLEEAKAKANCVIVDCVTCYEVYEKKAEEMGLEFMDFINLFYNLIPKDQMNEERV